MKRVILNLQEEELERAEKLASRLAVSRAEVFRRALAAFAELMPTREEEERRRTRRAEIAADMDAAAKELSKDPDWDPVAIIRAGRNRGRYR